MYFTSNHQRYLSRISDYKICLCIFLGLSVALEQGLSCYTCGKISSDFSKIEGIHIKDNIYLEQPTRYIICTNKANYLYKWGELGKHNQNNANVCLLFVNPWKRHKRGHSPHIVVSCINNYLSWMWHPLLTRYFFIHKRPNCPFFLG